MFYLIISFIGFAKYKFSIHSVTSILFALLVFSTIAAYLTGRLLDLPITYVFYEIYIAVLLFILFASWRDYSNIKGYDSSDINDNKLRKVERIIIWLNAFTFVVDFVLFLSVFALLVSGVINVTEFKNGGDSELRQSIFANLLPSSLITLAYLFAPFGYLSLSLHFHYLLKGNIRRAILHLVLSLTLILVGIIGLSRSALVTYVIVYLTIFLFIVPLLSKRLFKRTMLAILVFGSALGFVFSEISNDRFGEKYIIESKSLIDETENPQLVSILDYFSQWEYFGPRLMAKYNPQDISWSLYNSNGLAVAIQQQIYGSIQVNDARAKKYDRIMGEEQSAFHGCVARCIFDYGYIGTVLFILLNCYFNRKLGPGKRRIASFKTLLSMPLLLSFSFGFFSGNAYGVFNIDLAMVFMWLIYKYCKTGSSHKRINDTVYVNKMDFETII